MVVGLGNRLLGDDGVGLHVLDALRRSPLSSYVSIIDCGCDLLSLVPHLNRRRKIIIVDAVRAGGEPGTVYRLDSSEFATARAEMHSAHCVGAADALRLLKFACPALAGSEVVIIGIEPKIMERSHELSEEVRESMIQVARLIAAETSPRSSAEDQTPGQRLSHCH